MSTPKRYFQKNSFYHVYNRGNRKEKILRDKKDYIRFLDKVAFYKNKYEVDILCYCLMPNHFHLLLQQLGEIPVSKFMLALSTSYSKYFNLKYGEVGRLFQERFRAKLIETDAYLLQLSRYIHLNPSELTGKLEDYKWSSMGEYINPVKLSNVGNPKFILGYFSQKDPSADYKEFVYAARREEINDELKLLMIDL